jgi:hypothetical protein
MCEKMYCEIWYFRGGDDDDDDPHNYVGCIPFLANPIFRYYFQAIFNPLSYMKVGPQCDELLANSHCQLHFYLQAPFHCHNRPPVPVGYQGTPDPDRCKLANATSSEI